MAKTIISHPLIQFAISRGSNDCQNLVDAGYSIEDGLWYTSSLDVLVDDCSFRGIETKKKDVETGEDEK